MRVRYNKNAKNIIQENEHYIEKIDDDILTNEIHLEIGMGKGDFLIKSALKNRDSVYIGVELNMSVLAAAIKKIEMFEEENNVKLDNLYVMSFDAIKVDEVFETNTVDKLYLNFSDPWPKKKHAKRRLTHSNFLSKYVNILKDDAVINIKTDNRLLFEYTILSMNNYGFKFDEIYLDLHKTDKDNVLTEYERKFCIQGPIYMIIASNIQK